MTYRNPTPDDPPVKLPAFLERSRIINVVELSALLGYSVEHTRRLYRTGKIPAPVRIAGRKVGWPAHIAGKLVGASDQEAA